MHELDYEYYSKSPDDREAQADVAIKIKRHGTVIPPSGVEELIENESCYKFYECREDEAFKKYDEGVIRTHEVVDQKNTDHAESVDRAYRSVKKSSVYDLAADNNMEYNFDDPSEKRIDQEETADIIRSQTHI